MIQPYFEATPGLIVSEDDVRRLILSAEKHNWLNESTTKRLSKAITSLLLIIVVGYGLFNAPAFFLRTQFYMETNVFDVPNTVSSGLPSNYNPGLPLVQTGKVNTTPTQSSLEDNHIFINRIKVNAPINWDIENNNDAVLKGLETGVAALKGTAKPGENGNIFIVGHSSNYLWAKGDYKHVFALLPQVTNGDLITITYHNTPYVYRVSDIKTVNPDDTSVLKSDSAQLSLMTCVPLGTNLKRLVVIAKPIGNTTTKPFYQSAESTGNLLPAVK